MFKLVLCNFSGVYVLKFTGVGRTVLIVFIVGGSIHLSFAGKDAVILYLVLMSFTHGWVADYFYVFVLYAVERLYGVRY